MAPQLKLAGTQAKCTEGPFWIQLECTEGPFGIQLECPEGPFWLSKAVWAEGPFWVWTISVGQTLCTYVCVKHTLKRLAQYFHWLFVQLTIPFLHGLQSSLNLIGKFCHKLSPNCTLCLYGYTNTGVWFSFFWKKILFFWPWKSFFTCALSKFFVKLSKALA